MCGLRLIVASVALACTLLFLTAAGCGKGGGAAVPPASPPEPTQPPTGAIHGTVTYSGRIAGGQPILIEVFLEGSSKPIASTQIPSPGGAYAFELAPRSYTLRAWLSARGDPSTRLPADPTAWYDADGDGNADRVEVKPKATAQGIDITLHDPPSGDIQGTLRYVGKYKFEVEPPIRIRAMRSYPDPDAEILGETQIWYPGGEYALNATGAATCYVVAWLDTNLSGVFDGTDTHCVHSDSAGTPATVAIRDGAPVTGIDLEMYDPDFGAAHAQNWEVLRSLTAAGGNVAALAVDPGVSGTVYAAVGMAPWQSEDNTAYSKVFCSTDGGGSWKVLFWGHGDIRALAVRGDTLYAGSSGDEADFPIIRKSVDGGRTWASVCPGTKRLAVGGYRAQALAINPRVPSTVYAAGHKLGPPNWDSYSSFILRSTDDGKSWETVFQTKASGDYWNLNQISALAVDPEGQVVIAAGEEVVEGRSHGVIYRSADAGEHWTRAFATELAMQFTSLWMHPVTPTLVYAGSFGPAWDAHGRSGPDRVGPLFVSTDGGQNWSPAPEASGYLLAFQTPDALFACDGAGLVAGSASGEAQSRVTLGELPIATAGSLQALVADPMLPGRLYAGFSRGGVWVSDSGGATWQERNRGIRSLVWPCAIAIDPHDRNRIAVAAGLDGGFVSVNDGATWSRVITRECHTFAFDPAEPGLVYAGVGGWDLPTVLRSRDGGLSWSPAYTAPWISETGPSGQASVDALALDPSGRLVYAAGQERIGNALYGALLKSTDGGLQWTLVLTAPLWNYGFGAVAIDPRNPATVYAGGCNSVIDVGERPALWRTDDGGAHWRTLHGVFEETGSSVKSVVIDPQNSNNVLVANSGEHVARSTDGGQTWQEVLSGKDSAYLLAFDPQDPRYVYGIGAKYFGESSDGGRTWSEWSAQINLPIRMSGVRGGALAVDNRDGERSLYAGASGLMVWRRKVE